MFKTITWGFEPGELSDIQKIRIRIRTITLAEVGQHAQMARDISTDFDELLDKPLDEMTKKERDAIPPDLAVARKNESDWAMIRIATVSVQEMRQDSAKFTDTTLAELGWDSQPGSLEIPVDLFAEWQRRVIECNPGVFGYTIEAPKGEKKKAGVGLISAA